MALPIPAEGVAVDAGEDTPIVFDAEARAELRGLLAAPDIRSTPHP